jgi:hypothetical protein
MQGFSDFGRVSITTNEKGRGNARLFAWAVAVSKLVRLLKWSISGQRPDRTGGINEKTLDFVGAP